MHCALVALVSRRKGVTLSPSLGWHHTGLPPGSAIARGSEKPRTPFSVPK